jgi:hypothetical protein
MQLASPDRSMVDPEMASLAFFGEAISGGEKRSLIAVSCDG